MGARRYNEMRIHTARFPTTYVFIGYIGGVIHDVWMVLMVGTLSLSSGFSYVLSTGDSMYEIPVRSGAL